MRLSLPIIVFAALAIRLTSPGSVLFKQERLGLKEGEAIIHPWVNKAIEKMISSGEWKRALERNVGPSGYEIPQPPQITEKS